MCGSIVRTTDLLPVIKPREMFFRFWRRKKQTPFTERTIILIYIYFFFLRVSLLYYGESAEVFIFLFFCRQRKSYWIETVITCCPQEVRSTFARRSGQVIMIQPRAAGPPRGMYVRR